MLLAARSGDRIRVGIREFYLIPNVQAGCGSHPMDRGFSPGLMRPRREVTTHPHLLQRLRMSGTIPRLHLIQLMVGQGNFTPYISRHPPSICHSQDFYLWILALWAFKVIVKYNNISCKLYGTAGIMTVRGTESANLRKLLCPCERNTLNTSEIITHFLRITFNIQNTSGLGSSVGIATDYGLNGPGIEPG
jgi:hypothetical protein